VTSATAVATARITFPEPTILHLLTDLDRLRILAVDIERLLVRPQTEVRIRIEPAGRRAPLHGVRSLATVGHGVGDDRGHVCGKRLRLLQREDTVDSLLPVAPPHEADIEQGVPARVLWQSYSV
jgi:hypothetical protein